MEYFTNIPKKKSKNQQKAHFLEKKDFTVINFFIIVPAYYFGGEHDYHLSE